MENEILKYLSKYIPITNELEEEISRIEFIKCFDNGTVLLEEGNISNECYFIIKGCIRSFYIKDGEEKTTEFYTEEQAVIPSVYGDKIPSEYYLECIEDTIVGVGTPELETEMYQKFPQIESLNRALGEAIMAKNQDTFAEFKMASPEERYLALLKNRPDVIQIAPQHQIASYLGMKPESLSRIRKRIMSQK
ncbi:MAG: Crp/Fnr family transcriptional regulator [Bacteroidetes bacterium]|nr:Crp/Fnr family transcriptional regulator [Bacteroidota bacterium]MBT4968334.1 Crp/Fnr family transcriptional regulator [Bacteroidota bacterium]MBT5529026.1 Crp/Fnr family transcriptional regulator [Cytophagia bacterium]MBT7995120.1 Crp/Fnr family transcriptional regulator [Bacteroidota bacterium]